MTKDGVVVVSHDRLLNPDHTRDAAGNFLAMPGPAIVDLTYEELRQYDVGRIKPGSEYAAAFPGQQPADGERIPRLADVFALVERSGNRTVRFNIETKIDPAHPLQSVSALAFARALAAAIRDAGMASRTTVQSFDWRTLRLLGALAPEIGLVALTDQQPDEDTVEIGKPGASAWLGELDVDDHAGSVPKLVQALGAKTWSPHARDLTPTLVIEAHALGLAVVPWTVNDPKDMERAIAAGRRRSHHRLPGPPAQRAADERHRSAGADAGSMIGPLAPAAFSAPLPADRVDPEYRRLRRRVFTGIFVGYAGYYLVRNNLALADPGPARREPGVHESAARHGADGAFHRLRTLEVPDGLGLGPQQPEVLHAARAPAFGRAHGGLRAGRGALRVARRDHPRHGAERLGAGHGLAALRQDHGALVQPQGARAHRLDLERRAQHRRRAGREPARSSASCCSTTGARSSTSTRWSRR